MIQVSRQALDETLAMIVGLRVPRHSCESDMLSDCPACSADAEAAIANDGTQPQAASTQAGEPFAYVEKYRLGGETHMTLVWDNGERDDREYLPLYLPSHDTDDGFIRDAEGRAIGTDEPATRVPAASSTTPGSTGAVDDAAVRRLADHLGKRGGPLQSYNRPAQERIAREYLVIAQPAQQGERGESNG
jgi:hypothetical protein